MHDEEYYSVEVDEVVRETDWAILVRVNENDLTRACMDDDEVWIPLSQIVESSEVREEGDSGELHVTMWIAKEKGWF